MKFFLSNSFDVNACDGVIKMTPMHIAVECNHLEAVKLLLANGADVTLKDFRNKTPMQYASEEMKSALLFWQK